MTIYQDINSNDDGFLIRLHTHSHRTALSLLVTTGGAEFYLANINKKVGRYLVQGIL